MTVTGIGPGSGRVAGRQLVVVGGAILGSAGVVVAGIVQGVAGQAATLTGQA